jgi:hypothetical protein
MPSRLLLVASIALTPLLVAPTAGAAFTSAQLDAITQHLYRGGASPPISDPACNTSCASLWSKEQAAMTNSEWTRQLHRDLFLIRQKVGLLPPKDALRGVPLASNKPWIGWKFGVAPRIKWLRVAAPRPATDAGGGPITKADQVEPKQYAAGGLGAKTGPWEARISELGFWGTDSNGSPANAPRADFHPGYQSDGCIPFSEASLNYPGWEIGRGPTWAMDANCGELRQHSEWTFFLFETAKADGTMPGGIKDWTTQPVTEPALTSWTPGPAGGPLATLKAAVTAEVNDPTLYGALRAWYQFAFTPTGPPPTDDPLLAKKFRPVFRFDAEEKWRPLNVTDLIAEGTHYKCTRVTGTDPCTRLTNITSLASADPATSYLDLNGVGDQAADNYSSPRGCAVSPLLECDPQYAGLYYSVGPTTSSGYRYIDYWAFYRRDLDHEGDWEGVEVAPAPTGKYFDFASFSGHGKWYSYLMNNVECDDGTPTHTCGTTGARVGTRVRAYASRGKHANYARRCSIGPLGFGKCDRNNTALPDSAFGEENYGGERDWYPNYDGATTLLPLGSWASWPGTWSGTNEGQGGPLSPAKQAPGPLNTTCARDNPQCPARSARRRTLAQAAKAQRKKNRRNGRCGTWFGPDVVVAMCAPRTLGAAVASRRLKPSRDTAIRLRRASGAARHSPRGLSSSGAATGLAQALGAPLGPGDALVVRGTIRKGSIVLVRGVNRGRPLLARFRVPARARRLRFGLIKRGRQARIFGRTSSGRVLRGAAVRVSAY